MLKGGMGRSALSLPAKTVEKSGNTSSIKDSLILDLKIAWEFNSLNRFMPLVTGGVLDSLCYQYNGTQFNAPVTSNTQFGNKSFSVAFLVNNLLPDNSSYTFSMLFAADHFDSGQREGAISLYKPSLSNWGVSLDFGDGSSALPLRMSASMSYNLWTLIILNHNVLTKTGTLYLNNALVSTVSYTSTLGTSSYTRNFGYRHTGSGISGDFSACKCQFFYKWDRELTSIERDWLYNNGNFRFLTL
jgi:hypothetical protein